MGTMPHSSTAEQRAVNSKVPGSNPGEAANGLVHATPTGIGIKMDTSDYCIMVVRNLAKVNVRVRSSLVALSPGGLAVKAPGCQPGDRGFESHPGRKHK
jgi:hypothetical protein